MENNNDERLVDSIKNVKMKGLKSEFKKLIGHTYTLFLMFGILTCVSLGGALFRPKYILMAADVGVVFIFELKRNFIAKILLSFLK